MTATELPRSQRMWLTGSRRAFVETEATNYYGRAPSSTAERGTSELFCSGFCSPMEMFECFVNVVFDKTYFLPSFGPLCPSCLLLPALQCLHLPA